jgi:hypothetical protein
VQLTSVDRRTTIEISQAKRGGVHAPYKLRVESQGAIGGFSGENDSVHFLNIGEFKAAFETFLQVRQDSVTLRATDDCQLQFFRWNTKGDIGVRYVIGRQFIEGEAPDRSSIALSGKFQLHGEYVYQTAAQLLDVLNA